MESPYLKAHSWIPILGHVGAFRTLCRHHLKKKVLLIFLKKRNKEFLP